MYHPWQAAEHFTGIWLIAATANIIETMSSEPSQMY